MGGAIDAPEYPLILAVSTPDLAAVATKAAGVILDVLDGKHSGTVTVRIEPELLLRQSSL